MFEDHLLPDSGIYEGREAAWARMEDLRQIFSFEGNKVSRIRWFATPEAALEAAGLS